MPDIPSMQEIEVGRIFLDLENPRHEPYEKEDEIIDYLCRSENVFPLAKDIVQNGLNPLELLAVIPDEGSGGGKRKKQSYIVAEGNRRLCALKLLDDPERSPAKLRKGFDQLSADWGSIKSLTCMVFPNRESVRMWLGRIHEGEQGGIGRKKWNADQTARHSGDTKNKVALAVLDYAEDEGLITSEGRKGKLTTVQRYLANSLVREAIGVDSSNINDISRNRTKDDFDLLLRKFLDDLSAGTVHSRANRDEHIAYARELSSVHGQTHERTEPVSLAQTAKPGGKGSSKLQRPRRRRPRRFVPYEQEIMNALEGLGGDKLPSLYNSICSVSLESHTPLVAIGVWALFESLSARAGRDVNTSFLSFFSKSRVNGYGISSGKDYRSIAEPLRRLSDAGDITKHHGMAALFNGEQLINDMETLKDLIIKCADEAIAKS